METGHPSTRVVETGLKPTSCLCATLVCYLTATFTLTSLAAIMPVSRQRYRPPSQTPHMSLLLVRGFVLLYRPGDTVMCFCGRVYTSSPIVLGQLTFHDMALYVCGSVKPRLHQIHVAGHKLAIPDEQLRTVELWIWSLVHFVWCDLLVYSANVD